MTEETENIVLKLLREMRAEHTAQFEELRAQVGVVAQGLNSVRSELKLVREQIQEIALVVDHHTTRLDGIEHHLGLDASKH
jgi:hypothetical protein